MPVSVAEKQPESSTPSAEGGELLPKSCVPTALLCWDIEMGVAGRIQQLSEPVACRRTCRSQYHDFGTTQDVEGDGAGDSKVAPTSPVFTAN